MKSIKNIKTFQGKRVIVRVDFNVPMKDDGIVVDDFRIKKSIPTIKYLQKNKAKVVLISHLGDGGSMKPVFLVLKKYLTKVSFADSPVLSEETIETIKGLNGGEVILLENLRDNEGEKKNSPSFARALSRYADIYVNDAFSVSHRAHASVVGLPKHLPSYAGLQLLEEVENLSKVFNPKHPFLFILGGAKFETKIPLINKFLKRAEEVFIGGALANDFLKAKGYEVGKSLVGEDNFKINSFLRKSNLILPIDVEVINKDSLSYVASNKVKSSDCIIDIGPESIKKLEDLISKSKFILWNGPLGKYEDGFGGATEQIIKAVAKSNAYSVVGGGDTVSIISKLKLGDKISFVSTGGGATLDFLTKETLPGIKSLK